MNVGSSLSGLPTELFLDIVSNVPYGHTYSKNLQLVCKGFHHLMKRYEHTIAKRVLDEQFPWAHRQFPALFSHTSDACHRAHYYRALRTMYTRLATLSCIKSRCRVIRDRGSDCSAWTTSRTIRIHNAGLLILYRLQDCGELAANDERGQAVPGSDSITEDKQALLSSLPAPSLAVLLFTLMMSIHLLRATGPDMVLYHTTQRAESRSEIELACEEVILRDGPEFLLGLLQDNAKSVG